jgi:hypothetical protein
MNAINRIVILSMALLLTVGASAKKKETQKDAYAYGKGRAGTTLILTFEKGNEHNHPLFAVWLADAQGRFIETLFVSQSIGKGIFPRADRKKGSWQSGEIKRPAALPYWVHQRNVPNGTGDLLPTPSKPEVDGVTGATPPSSFVMKLTTSKPLTGNETLYVELNQSWDWNEYWYNAKFPGDMDYMTSSQPALVYAGKLKVTSGGDVIKLKPVGHSHYAGKDGSLNSDLSTLTTALKIAASITVGIP